MGYIEVKEIETNTKPRQPPNLKSRVLQGRNQLSLRKMTLREAVTLLRFLLTKFYRNDRKYTEEERAAIQLLDLFFHGVRNKGFYKTRGLEFLKLRTLLRITLKYDSLENCDKAKEFLLLKQRVLFSPREFLGLEHQMKRRPFLGVKSLDSGGLPLQPRQIGVGYRDKGTASEPSQDGSPRWTEVAMHYSTQEPEGTLHSIEWYEAHPGLL
jgi:hypothetical protein